MVVAVAAVAALVFCWTGPEESEPPERPAPHDPAPVADEAPRSETETETPDVLELTRGNEPVIDPDALVGGEPLRVSLALPPDAGEIGIESIWVYGETHDPTRIAGERTKPSEMRVEIPPELLTPGRHIVELRTDELTHIPLRRFSFEIR